MGHIRAVGGDYWGNCARHYLPMKSKSKGKRHPAHASSFSAVASGIGKALQHPNVDLMTPYQILALIGNLMDNEAKRLRKILR